MLLLDSTFDNELNIYHVQMCSLLLITYYISFGHCVICTCPSIYRFWLPFWYLQTLFPCICVNFI